MIDWIKGRELLEPSYNLTKRKIYYAVRVGALVPWESPDGVKTNRAWRFLPDKAFQKSWGQGDGELQEKYKRLIALQYELEKYKNLLSKSDEEHVSGGYWRNPEDEIRRILPEKRGAWTKKIEELSPQIKELEEELASNRIWKDLLDLGPAQQEALIDELLDASYDLGEVKAFLGTQSETPTPNTQPRKPTIDCKPGTKWEDIEIILIANDTVKINIKDRSERYSYHELRMSDKRKGDVSTKLWDFLIELAKHTGSYSPEKFDETLRSKATRMNKHLQTIFGIDDTIYMRPYRREQRYVTKFRIEDRRASAWTYEGAKRKAIGTNVPTSQTPLKSTEIPKKQVKGHGGDEVDTGSSVRIEIAEIFDEAAKRGNSEQ